MILGPFSGLRFGTPFPAPCRILVCHFCVAQRLSAACPLIAIFDGASSRTTATGPSQDPLVYLPALPPRRQFRAKGSCIIFGNRCSVFFPNVLIGRSNAFVLVLTIYPITQPMIPQPSLGCCQMFIPLFIILVQHELFVNSAELIELFQQMFLLPLVCIRFIAALPLHKLQCNICTRRRQREYHTSSLNCGMASKMSH